MLRGPSSPPIASTAIQIIQRFQRFQGFQRFGTFGTSGIALVLVNRSGLPPFVVPAVGADAMRGLRLVTVWTLAKAGRLEGVVRPALGRASFRVASFRIRHRLSF